MKVEIDLYHAKLLAKALNYCLGSKDFKAGYEERVALQDIKVMIGFRM